MSRWLALALMGVVALLAIVAAADEARAETKHVSIPGFSYSPSTIEVHQGDTIQWSNDHTFAHTATSSAGSWDTGSIPSGSSRSVAMDAVGEFAYVCSFHSNMQGTVRVLAGAPQNTPPAIVVTAPAFGSTVSGVVTISGTASDVEADPLTVGVRIDSPGSYQPANLTNGVWTFPWNTTALPNGAHTIAARASDGVNVTFTPTISVTVYNPPTIALAAPAEGANLTIGRVATVSGNATGAPNAVVTVAVSIDNGTFQAAQGLGAWTFAWNTSGLAPGNHTIQARASDGTTSVLSPVRNVTLSEPPPTPPNLAPTLVVVTPAQNATVSGIVNVSGTTSDPDGPPPVVEVSPHGQDWRGVTRRVGATWWYHWFPENITGNVTIRVRASDGNATTLVARDIVLDATSRALTLDLGSPGPREGRDVRARVTGDAGPAAGARLFLSFANGSAIMERTTDARGNASFGMLPNGSYVLRAFAPGAAATIPFVVKPRYDISVTPLVMSYDALQPIRVNVSADAPVGGLSVHLTGSILVQGSTPQVKTALDGTALVGYQPIAAGELAVWVDNNDTGLRVRLDPILRASWLPTDPIAGDRVTVRFSLNDAVGTRAAGALVAYEAPGEPPREAIADADGEIEIGSGAPGQVRINASHPSVRPISFRIPFAPPPPIPELRDLTARPGDSGLLVSVFVKNVGNGNGTFILDAIASAPSGAAVQQSARTRELRPGEEAEARFVLRIGGGDYTLTASVRNSTATSIISTRMPEISIPPPLVFNNSDETDAATSEGKGIPGVGALGLVAVALGAVARRRR